MSALICTECGVSYTLNEPLWRCRCGGLLDVEFQPRFERKKIKRRKPTMWRYREAIPIEKDSDIVSFDEGFTPLIKIPISGRLIWVKQEQLFPTGSYKDRGSSVLVSQIKSLKLSHIAEDSSGNAGSSISAYCAKIGVSCDIYVPESTLPGKLAQVELYGARLHLVPGNREDTASAVMEAAKTHYYASHSWNPFFFQGVKTFAYEICEQLDWKAPDTIILPVGNGSLLLGAAIGFNDLLRAGIISTLPRLIAIQAENCAPLFQAFKNNLPELPRLDCLKTVAEGIAIAAPIRWKHILKAITASGGDMIAVREDAINSALYDICRSGFYIEPTSAVAIAGVREYLKHEHPKQKEVIISVFTGHGLKAGEKMLP